ncbi:DnaD domain-containing protein [Leuconostoc citreum]|jgi:DNA replication protein|uniref:DNA replication protein DnaD n=1 Tax=Leuconostoc citreum TaxID=33964 RepID=A0A5A5TYS9_LEUCI|nr:DnaD domain protein [Leuconostoc citreum]KAF0261454.1 DNA replication protein DnaD [Leuconostoc citreum]MBA5937492.1 DnaD domain protein [Leuconostoc citreum]MBE4725212.1 DnaD domain protein [Leuconostoc citreum]MBU7450388.1 DnaD domain protein [Leuconostoc citreum]MCJ2166443.1 DnaD domain protein [Leuconostoc citreum]
MALEKRLQQYIQAGQTNINNDLLLHYQDIGMDNDDLALYLQVMRIQAQGNQATPKILAQVLHITETVVIARLKSLIARDLMVISTATKQVETYDFLPMIEKLVQGQKISTTPVMSDGKSTRREIFQTIESEFGRPLTPMEMQTIGQWFDQDHFEPDLMLLAIQEAVANNARSLRYIETILINWQRDQIKTPAQAQIAKQKRRGVTYTYDNLF